MKKIKLILSSLMLACFVCVNMHVLTSNHDIGNVLELEDVEALADAELVPGENGEEDKWLLIGFEMRTYNCVNGGYEYICQMAMQIDPVTCNAAQESYCDGLVQDSYLDSGGYNEICAIYGHNWIPVSLTYSECHRCGVKSN